MEVRRLFTEEFLTPAEVGLLREHIEPDPERLLQDFEDVRTAEAKALQRRRNWVADFRWGEDPYAKVRWLLPDSGQNRCGTSTFWLYRGCMVYTEGVFRSDDERELLVREVVMKRENRFAKLARLVALEERIQKASRREPIPDGVRMFVWQRDRGCCVQCGSKENLEFDHIIPVVKGGSNTERNLQLLCECCNRTKYDSVGGL